MSADISITVGKDGKVKIHGIKGVFGPSCENLTKELEKQGKLLKKTKTPDYYKDGGPKVDINTGVQKS